MLGLNRSWLSVSLVPVLAGLAGVAIPGEASACSPDPCYESNRITDFTLANAQVKPDGVLVFHSFQVDNGLSLEDALAYVDVQVLDADGIAIEGALEVLYDRVVLWRPASPLAPDTAHVVLATVDNDALGIEHDPEWINDEGWCGPNIELQQVVESTSGSFSPLQVTVSESEEVNHSVIQGLDTLVCCDGAMPREEYWCGDIPDIFWEEGFCTSDTQRGRLTATFEVAPPSSDEGELGNLAVMLHTGSEFRSGLPGNLSISRSAEEPFCSVVELVNVATGQSVLSEEFCVGEDVADQLGMLPLDASDQLAEACAGEPYVCEVNGDGWDPERCGPWTEPDGGDGDGGEDGGDGDGGDGGDGDGGSDGGEDDGGDGDGGGGLDDDGIADRGCGCRAQGGSSGPWGLAWGMLGLVLWRRRRRR